MKNRKFLALIAAILCLSMLFVGCKNEEEVIDTEKDIEAILNALAGTSAEQPDLSEIKIPDVNAELAKLMADVDFELTDLVVNGEKAPAGFTFLYQDSVLYMISGSEANYMLFSPELAMAMVSNSNSDKKLMTNDRIQDDMVETLQQISSMVPAGASLKDLMDQSGVSAEAPVLEASDFEHVEGHSYKLADSYFEKLYDFVMAELEKVAGEELPAADKAQADSMFAQYMEWAGLEIVYTLKDDVVSTMTVGVDFADELCKEMFGSSSIEYKDKMHFKAELEIDIVNVDTAPLKVTVDAKIPTGSSYSTDSNGENETRGVAMTEMKVDAMLNLSKLGSTNDTVLELKLDETSEWQHYVNGKYSESETNARGNMKDVATMEVYLKTCEKAGKFAFGYSMSNDHNGEETKMDFSAKASFVDVPAQTLPNEVKAYQERLNSFSKNYDAIMSKMDAYKNNANLVNYVMNNNLSEKEGDIYLYLSEYNLYVEVELYRKDKDTFGIDFYGVYMDRPTGNHTLITDTNGNFSH